MIKALRWHNRLRRRWFSRANRMRYDTRFPSAYCLHMHRMDAIKRGETEDRLLLLDAWRESELYTERERAALAWAEALTRISESRASDADYEKVRSTFSNDELLALSIGIATINAWNRLAIGFRLQHPADRVRAAA